MLGTVGAPELILISVGVVVPIWAWSNWVLVDPQDFGLYLFWSCGTQAGVAFVVTVLWAFVRPPAPFRQRLHLSALSSQSPTVFLLVAAMPVVDGLSFLAITPSDRSMADLDPSFSVWKAIVVLTLIGQAAVSVGGAVVFWVLLVPLAVLLGAVLGSTDRGAEASAHGDADGLAARSRTELVSFALLILCAAGLGVSLVAAGGTSSGSTRRDMGEQLRAAVGFERSAVWSLAAIAFLAASVALLVVFVRALKRSDARWASSGGR